MLIYKVKPKPRAENSLLLKLKAQLLSYNASNFGLNKEYRAVFLIEF